MEWKTIKIVPVCFCLFRKRQEKKHNFDIQIVVFKLNIFVFLLEPRKKTTVQYIHMISSRHKQTLNEPHFTGLRTSKKASIFYENNYFHLSSYSKF